MHRHCAAAGRTTEFVESNIRLRGIDTELEVRERAKVSSGWYGGRIAVCIVDL